MGPSKERKSQIYSKSWPEVIGKIDLMIDAVIARRKKFYGRVISKQLFINAVFLGVYELTEKDDDFLMRIYDEGAKQYQALLASSRMARRRRDEDDADEAKEDEEPRPRLKRRLKIPMTNLMLDSVGWPNDVERTHGDNQRAVLHGKP